VRFGALLNGDVRIRGALRFAGVHDRWVTQWKGLRLDLYNFDNDYDEDCQDDNNIEALHLSCALRAVG
jgi:hypothetical protein